MGRVSWLDLTVEEVSLFNPGFAALLVSTSVRSHVEKSDLGCPLSLQFLVLPLAVHSRVRQRLPRSIGTSLARWILQNPDLRVGLGSRAAALVPFTKAGLELALRSSVIGVDTSGNLVMGDEAQKLPRRPRWPSDDVRDAVRAAAFFGRWFAAQPPANVYALLGVSP